MKHHGRWLVIGAILWMSQIAVADIQFDQRWQNLLVKYQISAKAHVDAIKELTEHVQNCGFGVIEGEPGENRCDYHIRIDEQFLQPLAKKTGYIYNPNWPYEAGVEFLSLSQKMLEGVPEAWDLSEVGPMTDIHRQRCGDCWSTSSRKLLEQALATHGVRDDEGELIKLSAQTTLSSCCRWCGSCQGGYMSTPNFFSTEGSSAYGYGLPTRSQDPYLGRDSSCRFTSQQLKAIPYKLVKAPYVGLSLNYSRYFAPEERQGAKVEQTKALMYHYKSNALVTIQAISSSGGVITSCSAINAYGNHMQNIVGWYQKNGMQIARVQNSWGTSHGQGGYTHIRWECGDGRLNRGLGRSTRVAIIDSDKICKNIATAQVGHDRVFNKADVGKGIVLGTPSRSKQKCEWLPKAGIVKALSNDGCQILVNPDQPTEYHLIARESECGTIASAMVLVTPLNDRGEPTGRILTPFGETENPAKF